MKKLFVKLSFIIIIAVTFSSCVNIDQQTTINKDGSGSIALHYWTHTSNLSMGNELGGFSFEEAQVKKKFTSLNSDVTEVKIDNDESDSSSHVRVKITFKDFNKLNEAEGFSKTKSIWKKEKDKIIFNYTLMKDTVSSDKMASDEYKLIYGFSFPDQVLTTNGDVEGNLVTWDKSLSDLNEDIVMSAEINDESGVCGLFGIELPLVLLFGMSVLYRRR